MKLLHIAGMVILHPDLLLSGTRVSGSFKCKRQAVLEERFGGNSSDKAVEGTLLHELFQVSTFLAFSSPAGHSLHWHQCLSMCHHMMPSPTECEKCASLLETAD